MSHMVAFCAFRVLMLFLAWKSPALYAIMPALPSANGLVMISVEIPEFKKELMFVSLYTEMMIINRVKM